MLDIKLLRENPDAVRTAMKNRGLKIDLNELVDLDKQHRELLQKLESLRAEQNKTSKGPASADDIKRLRGLKDQIKTMESEESNLSMSVQDKLRRMPNLPLEDTPVGKDASDNKIMREVGEKAKFNFQPKSYIELSESLDIIDVQSAGVVSGSRFGYLKGAAARLEFALVQLAMDLLTDYSFVETLIRDSNLNIQAKPFLPVVPPVMIRPEMMRAMGFTERAGMPPGTDEIYYLDKDELYLVGTSEQSIGPMHYKKILEEAVLPLRYLSFSTCFRREAGSYGKDTKGILRVHQFDKLEMFTVATPETSRDEHLLLLAAEEALMQKLNIPYRVVRLCTADIGAASAATYDIDTWLPGQGEYRETHSTSNTTDYQSRALDTRYRKLTTKNSKHETDFVHMLNGTAFAIGRTLIAIIENYQTKEGTVIVPEVLQPYMNGVAEVKKIG